MRFAGMFCAVLFLAIACGDEGPQTTVATPSDATEIRNDKEDAAAVATSPVISDDPCAPLEAEMVRYDTSGKPYFFSFEYPRGFTVKEWFGPGVSGADLTFNVDGKGRDEYVLRLSQGDKLLANPENLVKVWRELPITVSVTEKELDGGTMYIQRANIGGMSGFIALFPALEPSSGSYHLGAGITNAPKPCSAQAQEVVAKIVMSFQRNPNVGPNPGDVKN